MTALAIPLRGFPAGTRVTGTEAFYTTMARPNDTYTEKITLHVCGVSVTLICYEQDTSQIMVYIGGSPRPAMMPLDCVGQYLTDRVRR